MAAKITNELNLHSMAKQIEVWVIDKLIPWARNPRTHSDAQIVQIPASIAEFGFNNPILVDTGIIAGQGEVGAVADPYSKARKARLAPFRKNA
jgi:hypothetical protein